MEMFSSPHISSPILSSPHLSRKPLRTPPRTPTSARRTSKSSKKSRNSTPNSSDRFIPNRAAMNLEHSFFALMQEKNEDIEKDVSAENQVKVEYKRTLKNTLLNSNEVTPGLFTGNDHKTKVLAFRNKAPSPKSPLQLPCNSLKVLYSQNNQQMTKAKFNRHIADAPTRILDAPDLVDDYYLNLLSWSSQNVLAVALGQAVYLWNAETGAIDELMQCSDADDYVTSLSWVADGGHLAIGTNHSDVQLWDASTLKQIRHMAGHEARVSALAWNSHILSSGSRDSSIINHDVRVRQHHVSTFAEHQQEVCGLSWSSDGTTLASGGNDNLLCLWDASSSGRSGARFTLKQHAAAVKALAWSPHERNVLASGGGTADRTIKFWNTQNGAMLNTIDTGSQVCSLLWSQTDKEILSSHGFSQNQLCLWKYPNMMKVKELKGHTARVLHMAASPNGTTVVSAAADETLRFWDIFAAPSKLDKKGSLDSNSKFMSSMRIR